MASVCYYYDEISNNGKWEANRRAKEEGDLQILHIVTDSTVCQPQNNLKGKVSHQAVAITVYSAAHCHHQNDESVTASQ